MVWFLEFLASLQGQDMLGWTPLDYAAALGHEETLDVMAAVCQLQGQSHSRPTHSHHDRVDIKSQSHQNGVALSLTALRWPPRVPQCRGGRCSSQH